MAKLTKRFVEAVEPQSEGHVVWDDEYPGFGLRVYPSGKRSYIVQYRSRGRSRRYTIGLHGIWTPETARREAWRRKFVIDRDIVDAEPNRGHRAVAKLVRVGKVTSVITQNIDNLHQNSGIPAKQIIELHGNGTYANCLTCWTRYELGRIKEAFEADDRPPSCTFCGGHVKAATISFGQAMPDAEMARARQEALACDLLLAIGSSLVVYPAAGFPVLAKENGAQLVILNREATDLDRLADLVINREIGPTLGEVADVN